MILFREKYSFQHTVGKAGSLAKGSIREYSFPPLVFVVNFYVLICVKFLWELQEQLIFFKYQFFTEACGWEWSEGLQFSLTKCFLFSVTQATIMVLKNLVLWNKWLKYCVVIQVKTGVGWRKFDCLECDILWHVNNSYWCEDLRW